MSVKIRFNLLHARRLFTAQPVKHARRMITDRKSKTQLILDGPPPLQLSTYQHRNYNDDTDLFMYVGLCLPFPLTCIVQAVKASS